MVKVKIYGAGSIGNHLAFACRNRGWDVLICDIATDALERTKKNIYPTRYGKWDKAIRLVAMSELKPEQFDLIILGTPPDTHIALALDILRKEPPKALLIEKPLCTPSLDGAQELQDLAISTGTFVGVGYNHILTQNTQIAKDIINDGLIGKPLTISARFREHWGGIFAAHPWLDGPQDTYLGFSERGGGASGEHSHAINIWQHFSHLLDMGRVTEVSAMLDMVDDGQVRYDRICQLSVRTEKGLVGDIVQDVITEPAEKILRVQGSKGFLEWLVNYDKSHDAIRYWNGHGELQEELITKTRPDDFKGEIDHVQDILEGNTVESPISIERGLETMLVVAAVHKSHQLNRNVRIDYDNSYSIDCIY